MDATWHHPFLGKIKVLKRRESGCPPGASEVSGRPPGVRKSPRRLPTFLKNYTAIKVVAGKGRKDSSSSHSGASASSSPFSVLKGVQFSVGNANTGNGSSHSSGKSKRSSSEHSTANGNKVGAERTQTGKGDSAAKTRTVESNSVSGLSHKQTNEPPRIMSNLNATLRLLKHCQDVEQKSKAVQATSYRKKKAEKPKASGSSNMLDADSYIAGDSDAGFEGSQGEAVLIVDGYNICGFWPRLKRYFARGDLETARERLLVDLAMYGSVRGVRVIAAFDATSRGKPTSREHYQGIDVVFTLGEADAWIEQEVGNLRAKGCPRVWVATSDHTEGDYCSGKGAVVWSASYLVSEIKTAKKDLEERLENLNPDRYSFKGKLLEHGLDNDTVTSLKHFRMELANSER